MGTITITGEQAAALLDALAEGIDGEGVTLTGQGDGTLVVGFSLTTEYIATDGEREEQ